MYVVCCRRSGDEGRESRWVLESAAYKVAFHIFPFRAILCRGGPGRVAREIGVVSVRPGWF